VSERTRRMKAHEVERILQRYGFQLVSQKGSHRTYQRQLDGLEIAKKKAET